MRYRLPRRTVRLRLTALYAGLFLASGVGLLAITNILARGLPWHIYPAAEAPFGGGPGQYRATAGTLARELVSRDHAAALSNFLVESAIALGIMAVVSVALGWLMAGRVLRPLRQMTAATRAISEDNLRQRLAVPGPDDELKDLGDTIDAVLDRLEAAFDAQRNFVANASHELRTPLTLSRTLLQMALTDPRPTLAGYRAVCQDVLEAGVHTEQLIEALLTLARSQRGLDRRELVDLGAIARQALDVRARDAAARGLAISASITPAPVAGDARLLQRLAANLIDNAIRHNIPGGHVDIRVAADGGQPRFTIANTGPVIAADQAPRLLQPFQRLSTSRLAEEQGLGLGLSIVAAIARAHHATLTVKPGPQGGLDVEAGFSPANASAESADRAALATA